MPTVRIGYRRLFQVLECGLETVPIQYDIPLGVGVTCTIRIDFQPLFGLYQSTSSEKYLRISQPHKQQLTLFLNALEAPSPHSLFAEFSALFEIEADDKAYALLQSDDPSPVTERFLRAARKREIELSRAVDFAVGSFGLRAQRQLVLELINENFVVKRTPTPIVEFVGEWAEILDSYLLRKHDLDTIASTIAKAGTADKHFGLHADTLGWLSRAWAERNIVMKFLALFTALECSLGGVQVPTAKEDIEVLSILKRLASDHGDDKKSDLLNYLKRTSERMRPSLETRFARLANSTGWLSASADISAFRAFNKIRNDLIHRGDDSVKLSVKVEEDKIAPLEDLVERYVSFVVFGDKLIYPSRSRLHST